MFAKFFTTSLVLLTAASSVSAHTLFAPALGVKGNGARSDVQRANNNCGNANVASTIDSSTAIPLAADGTFTVTATDFNAGGDGSRAVKTAGVDAAGTGKAFKAVTISKNGNANPTSVGSDQITLKMPAGTTCTGGKAGNRCLVSLTSTAGFGNCVVVSGSAAGGKGNAAAAGAAAGAAGGAAAGNGGKKIKGVGSAAAQAGAAAKAAKAKQNKGQN
jgi:hypothetical protein